MDSNKMFDGWDHLSREEITSLETSIIERTERKMAAERAARAADMLTVIIPDPDFLHGECRKEIHADTPENLAIEARTFIDDCGYGASKVGGLFNVFRDGNIVATLAYNGRFTWRDPLYRPQA